MPRPKANPVSGALNSTPDTEFRLEFFSNNGVDPSGHGEGEMFIGSTSVVTDAAGQAALAATFSADVPVEYYATATAIDPEGNTSGFSAATEVEALSSQQQVQILVDAVHDFADAGVLKASQTNGLIAKLRAAIDALDRDKSKVAVNRLSDFIDQVEGVLSPEDGAELIALAQRMIERISG